MTTMEHGTEGKVGGFVEGTKGMMSKRLRRHSREVSSRHLVKLVSTESEIARHSRHGKSLDILHSVQHRPKHMYQHRGILCGFHKMQTTCAVSLRRHVSNVCNI